MNPCTYIIQKLRLHRGRESTIHVIGKLALGLLFWSRKFFVLFEHSDADCVAFRPSGHRLHITCAEHDTAIKTVPNNVRRDFANGCRSLAILVPDESARAAVRRLLRREFPRDIWSRVGVLTYDACRSQLEKLSIEPASVISARLIQPRNKNSKTKQ